MLAGWNTNRVCFDAVVMDALCDNSNHIMQPQLGTTSITGLVNEGEGAEMKRMSLYEQLTVSSQRFAQLSDHCRPSATSSFAEHSMFKENQQSSSSLTLALLPQSDKIQSFTCPFFGTIKGTDVSEGKFNDAAIRQAVAVNDIALRTIAAATMSGNLDGITRKKSEECLASLPPGKSIDNKKELTPLVSGQDTSCADLMMLVKGAQYLSLGDISLHNAATCKEEVLSPQSEACTGIYNKIAVSTFGLRSKALAQNESCGEQGAKHAGIFGVGHIPQPEDKFMLLDIDAQIQGEGCSSERCLAAKENKPDAMLWFAAANASLQESDPKLCNEPELPGHDAKVLSRELEIALPISDAAVGHSTANCAVGMDCRTCDNSATGGSCKCKSAETSSIDIQIKDDPEAGCATPISSKSVIQAVGQLRFWKARLALIRQQRAFSDQVFELHKLIEVQRLIAGTPNVPINEMYFNVGNMITDSDSDGSPCDFVEIEGVNAEASSQKEDPTSEEVGSAPLIVTEANSKLCDGQYNCPSNMADVENKVSTWRCSSLGVVPWATPKPVQTGVCPYPPFSPGFLSGPAVSCPFAPAIQEHGAATTDSPLFPVSLPRPHATTSVQSSYGSAVASAHQQQSVSNHDRSLGCKVTAEPRTPKKKHCVREGPTISLTSINHQPDMSLHRMRTASSATNSPLQGYDNKVHSSKKALEVLGSQPGNLHHASMGADLNTSMARPPCDRRQYPKHDEVDAMHAVDMHQEYSVKKMGSFRGWKRQQVRGQEVDGVNSLNRPMGALNLFPLAPTLTSHGDSRGPSRGGKEWQGHAIKVVPRAAESASESAAGILLSIQQERKP